MPDPAVPDETVPKTCQNWPRGRMIPACDGYVFNSSNYTWFWRGKPDTFVLCRIRPLLPAFPARFWNNCGALNTDSAGAILG